MSETQNTNTNQAKSVKNLLQIQDLRVYFKSGGRIAKAVDNVNLDIHEDEILGLIGESGSGKSVTASAILRLIPQPPGIIESGSIMFKGQDLLKIDTKELRKVRGGDIAMIFQDPMTSLNPIFKIKTQLMETLLAHNPTMKKEEALQISIDMLKKVGIPSPERRINEYSFNYSGGMRQRVMIAMALLNAPSLLIADEPTTALDVTIEAQIFDLMMHVKADKPESSILLVTHDLSVVNKYCDRVSVMYGGNIQEIAPAKQIFEKPLHPYTEGLKDSIPKLGHKVKRLSTIPGSVPSIFDMPRGCKFCTRCKYKKEFGELCEKVSPPMVKINDDRFVRCFKYVKDLQSYEKQMMEGKNE